MIKNVLTGQLKPIQINYAPADDKAGSPLDTLLSGADFSTADPDDEPDDEPEEKPVVKEPAKETLPKPAEIDYDTMATKFGEKLGEQLRPKDEGKPPMTDAERRALLKIWEPNDEWLEEFNTPAKQRDALMKLLEGQREHQNLMLQATVRHLEEKFGAQLAPIQQKTQEESAKQIFNEFTGAYPVLADPKYNDVVRFAASELRGRNFANQSEGFKALATLVEKTVKNFDPKFSLSGGPAGNNKNKTDDSRRLPVTKSGAGGSSKGEDGGGGAKGTSVIDLLVGKV